MKKIFLASLLFAASGLFLTGCLKDKGFDNYEYGINDPDTQPPGVSFIFGAKAKNDVGLDVTASTQVINDLVYVRLESGKPAPSDITVNLSVTSAAQVNAYNTANGTNYLVLDPSRYNVATSIVIPAGETKATVPLNVLNTIGLDASRGYAIALTITSVSNNYVIASNSQNLFIAFTIKNQYDGKYTLKGQFYHPSYPFYPFATTVEMWTTGPNSVKLYWPLAGAFAGPFATSPTGSGLTYFGSQEPEFTVNSSTNAVTVFNSFPGATTTYSMGIGYDNLGYNSRWVPATKTMYACYGYNLGAGGAFVAGTSREWIDTLVRTGPR